jgi:hypothetical protein
VILSQIGWCSKNGKEWEMAKITKREIAAKERQAEKHPDYPIRHGVPAMDRCICGGVRHWHAPDGCDDCDCRGFVLDENWRP